MKLSQIVAWFPILLMALLAIVAYWLSDVIQRSSERPATIDHEPDYRIYQFQVRNFSKTGYLSNILHGQSITHYADDKTATIDQPVLFYRASQEKPAYRASAQKGLANENLREITLSENVRIIRQPLDGISTTLYTNQIQYNDKTGIAFTKDPVTIVSGNNRFTANQLTAYTQDDKLELQGAVNATFYPNSTEKL